MAIPAFQEITLPLLQIAGDGQVHVLADTRARLARHFGLTADEEEELLPSGKQRRFANRVAWAKVYLQRAGLLASPSRGQFQITSRGSEVLSSPPAAIDIRFLRQFPGIDEFRSSNPRVPPNGGGDGDQGTPEEVIEAACLTIRAGLAADLLERVKASTPQFFEGLVMRLLLSMGYGRTGGGSGEVTGKSGDEGIDGIIAEDRLGLEMVYLQAKRWEGTVGRPEIQKFVGALHGRRARKGVFITTGTFSADALAYVKTIEPKVALVDGVQMAQLMIDFNVGVSLDRIYEVKRIDSDSFDE